MKNLNRNLVSYNLSHRDFYLTSSQPTIIFTNIFMVSFMWRIVFGIIKCTKKNTNKF